jgi:PTS system mannitol-specific IIA component/PTS system ascorbate-specific IIA component
MLEKYIEDHIQVVDSISTWEESIVLASQKILEKGYITDAYVDAMIQNVHENGSYIVIMPKVALPHARPKDMVNKTTLSIMKVNDGVMYPENKKIELVIVLAAIDSDAHLEIISELSEILVDESQIERLLNANSLEKVKEALEMV